MSPALAGRFLTTAPPGKPLFLLLLTFYSLVNFKLALGGSCPLTGYFLGFPAGSGGAPCDGAAPPPGCRGQALGEQAAATPRPGSLAGRRHTQKGGSQRPQEEARTEAQKREGGAGRPRGVVWGTEKLFLLSLGAPGQALDG